MTVPSYSETRPAPQRRSLLDRKRQVTRDAIVDAVVEVVSEHGADFSVQDAADRAGVTHRTVYRYFSSRESLLDAVAERYETWLAEEGIEQPESFDGVLGQVELLFRLFDERPDLVRAVATHTLASGRRTAPSSQRTQQWDEFFGANLSHLPREEVQAAFAICRTLIGSVGWYLLASQFGLTGAQSGSAVRRVVEALVTDLRQQEAAARRASTRRD